MKKTYEAPSTSVFLANLIVILSDHRVRVYKNIHVNEMASLTMFTREFKGRRRVSHGKNGPASQSGVAQVHSIMTLQLG